MNDRFSLKHFIPLWVSSIALIVIPFVLSMQDVLQLFYGLPWFIWPFLAIIATFFIVMAIPRARIAFSRLEMPETYSPKHFLLLLWLTAQAFLLGIILHNGIYALGMIAGHIAPLSYLLEGLHVAFFIIALTVVPAGYIVGAIGRVWGWAIQQPINEMRTKGIQLPTTWPYFALIGSCVWLWKFGKGIEVLTERRIRAAGVFASVFFLGIIGFVIIRAAIQRRLIIPSKSLPT
jgi:hypothetical protein